MSLPLIAVKAKNSWSYGFDLLDVDEVLHAPVMQNETTKKAQVRVLSAAICWKNLNPSRSHIKFQSKQFPKHIKITRIQ